MTTTSKSILTIVAVLVLVGCKPKNPPAATPAPAPAVVVAATTSKPLPNSKELWRLQAALNKEHSDDIDRLETKIDRIAESERKLDALKQINHAMAARTIKFAEDIGQVLDDTEFRLKLLEEMQELNVTESRLKILEDYLDNIQELNDAAIKINTNAILRIEKKVDVLTR